MPSLKDEPPLPLDAVVIGGSTGGIEALLSILPPAPASYPLPIVVVLHLSPDKPSLLSEIFGDRCAMQAREAEDKEPLVPGFIYFAPPDYHLLFESPSCLTLSVDDPVSFARPSIDVCFESAADVFGKRVLGVLLSGANGDGGMGLASIQARGGLTAVQEPLSAVAPEMPRSALRLFEPTHILRPAQLARLVLSVGSGKDPKPV